MATAFQKTFFSSTTLFSDTPHLQTIMAIIKTASLLSALSLLAVASAAPATDSHAEHEHSASFRLSDPVTRSWHQDPNGEVAKLFRRDSNATRGSERKCPGAQVEKKKRKSLVLTTNPYLIQ